MIQASGREDTSTDQSKIVVHISKIASDYLGMANREGFIFQDKRIEGAHIDISHVSFLTV
jgi:hypothetical protein